MCAQALSVKRTTTCFMTCVHVLQGQGPSTTCTLRLYLCRIPNSLDFAFLAHFQGCACCNLLMSLRSRREPPSPLRGFARHILTLLLRTVFSHVPVMEPCINLLRPVCSHLGSSEASSRHPHPLCPYPTSFSCPVPVPWIVSHLVKRHPSSNLDLLAAAAESRRQSVESPSFANQTSFFRPF